jgi:hypothetical protein
MTGEGERGADRSLPGRGCDFETVGHRVPQQGESSRKGAAGNVAPHVAERRR